MKPSKTITSRASVSSGVGMCCTLCAVVLGGTPELTAEHVHMCDAQDVEAALAACAVYCARRDERVVSVRESGNDVVKVTTSAARLNK